jgi:DNA polymerase-3 subunit alpha
MPQWIWEGEKRGIQIIPGCELYVAWDFPRHMKDSDHKVIYHMVALATNQVGYQNLMKLCSEGFLSGKYYKPRVDKELLEKYKEGIIFTTACLNGIFNAKLNRQGKEEVVVKEEAEAIKTLLGDQIYFEVQRHPNTPEQDTGNEVLKRFSEEYNIPLVATCDSHYGKPEHYDAWVSLMTLQMNGFPHTAPNDFYVKSQQEMLDLFSDWPEVTANTMKIADQCEPIVLDTSYKFPVFETGSKTLEETLREDSLTGLNQMLDKKKITGTKREEYKQRLNHELDIINGMGFPGYMLIVADFCQFAKENGVPLGPGRGSAAGCLVAYVLGITNVDPIKYGTLMERFLNPERVSMPDIDLDFGHRVREKMKDYAAEKYGEDKVASIMTIGTMAARGALRDMARVFKLSFQEGDQLSKAVPEGKRGKNVYLRTITDPSHEDYSPEFMELVNSRAVFQDVVRVAKIVEGMAKSSGTHAAGVIISDDKALWEHTALMLDKHDNVTSQYDMKVLEKLGLIKFDFLGLSTLTVIDDTVKAIEEKYGETIDIDEIDESDPATFELLCTGNLQGVFQLSGSSGFKNVVMQIQPHSIEEIADITSLYRPGPLDNGFIPMYVEAKKSNSTNYMIEIKSNPEINQQVEELLKPTKGVLVYQEQVMKLAQIMGGYSLGKADLLRRAMGKKIEAEMEACREEFVSGCYENGIENQEAMDTFDIIAKFAEYGFNKSHAIAYSILTYQTAWLKAHYPKEFLAACLTDEMGKQDKTITYINDAKANDIKILPPDINESEEFYTATPEGIRFGLAAIKDFGDVGAEYVIKERKKNGEYKSFIDFAQRVNLQKVNKSKIQTLIRVGCFDNLQSA